MVNQFRYVVSMYINQNSENKNWEEIRELFSVYSYVVFLVVAIKNINGKVDAIKEQAISIGLESKDNLNLIFSYPASKKIAEEIAVIIDDKKQIDILDELPYPIMVRYAAIMLLLDKEGVTDAVWERWGVEEEGKEILLIPEGKKREATKFEKLFIKTFKSIEIQVSRV